MTEVFFSYSSRDRERIRIFHDAFAKQGFEVFWDVQVPAGSTWDTVIKSHLEQARCVVVFWTVNSAASHNVTHEVAIAREQGKLLQVMLDPLTTRDLPMGIIMEQAVQLAGWDGTTPVAEWDKLVAAAIAKATPVWLQSKMTSLERQLRAAKKQIEESDVKIRTLETEQENESKELGDLRRQRDSLIAERDDRKTAAETADRTIAAERESHRKAMADYGEQAASRVRDLQFALDQKSAAHATLLDQHKALTVQRDELMLEAQAIATRLERKHADERQAASNLIVEANRTSARLLEERDALAAERERLLTAPADFLAKLDVANKVAASNAGAVFFALAILCSMLSYLPMYAEFARFLSNEAVDALRANHNLFLIFTVAAYIVSYIQEKIERGILVVVGFIGLIVPVFIFLWPHDANPQFTTARVVWFSIQLLLVALAIIGPIFYTPADAARLKQPPAKSKA